jgi:hypothetical protein
MKELNDVTKAVIGCAIEVHPQLGPGLLEASYESALCIELDDAGLGYRRQIVIPAIYKGRPSVSTGSTCLWRMPLSSRSRFSLCMSVPLWLQL